MTISGRAGIVHAAACVLFALLPLAVSAQTADPAQTPRSTGPMTVERVKSGFLIAPDFKVTRFDGKTSPLAGVYGGWLNDQTLFFGAGAYWNTDRSRAHDLTYAGFVAGSSGTTGSVRGSSRTSARSLGSAICELASHAAATPPITTDQRTPAAPPRRVALTTPLLPHSARDVKHRTRYRPVENPCEQPIVGSSTLQPRGLGGTLS